MTMKYKLTIITVHYNQGLKLETSFLESFMMAIKFTFDLAVDNVLLIIVPYLPTGTQFILKLNPLSQN